MSKGSLTSTPRLTSVIATEIGKALDKEFENMLTKMEQIQSICDNCHKYYIKIKRTQRFCSDKCRYEWHKLRYCPHCGRKIR